MLRTTTYLWGTVVYFMEHVPWYVAMTPSNDFLEVLYILYMCTVYVDNVLSVQFTSCTMYRGVADLSVYSTGVYLSTAPWY